MLNSEEYTPRRQVRGRPPVPQAHSAEHAAPAGRAWFTLGHSRGQWNKRPAIGSVECGPRAGLHMQRHIAVACATTTSTLRQRRLWHGCAAALCLRHILLLDAVQLLQHGPSFAVDSLTQKNLYFLRKVFILSKIVDFFYRLKKGQQGVPPRGRCGWSGTAASSPWRPRPQSLRAGPSSQSTPYSRLGVEASRTECRGLGFRDSAGAVGALTQEGLGFSCHRP